MESRAPAVVAVVVTTGSGPGLEAAVASLAVQSYEELACSSSRTGRPSTSRPASPRLPHIAEVVNVQYMHWPRPFLKHDAATDGCRLDACAWPEVIMTCRADRAFGARSVVATSSVSLDSGANDLIAFTRTVATAC